VISICDVAVLSKVIRMSL